MDLRRWGAVMVLTMAYTVELVTQWDRRELG